MNTNLLGLNRLLSFNERRIEAELSELLCDLFDDIDVLRDEARAFEILLQRIFQGERWTVS